MHHTRRALPYWRSIRARKSFSVVQSARVARQHLVGERKALRRHHQRDDHLHAVGAMIARVAVAALVRLVRRRIGLEIRARQVIQEHIEARVEQIPPAIHQMIEQRLACARAADRDSRRACESRPGRAIDTQQIAQRAALEPVPMQAPLAARREQPIHHQHQEHLIPTRAFARGRRVARPRTRRAQAPATASTRASTHPTAAAAPAATAPA